MATERPDTDETDLPIQPTGSGVADMEIARMQAAVTEEEPDPGAPTETQA